MPLKRALGTSTLLTHKNPSKRLGCALSAAFLGRLGKLDSLTCRQILDRFYK